MGNDVGHSAPQGGTAANTSQGNAAPRSGKAGLWVVAACILVGSGLGVYVYFDATRATITISHELDGWHAKGKSLDADACVGGVLDWFDATCRAPGRICLDAVPRAVGNCLAATDRAARCAELGPDQKSAQWAFDQCRQRGIDRSSPKPVRESCTLAWRALDTYCKSGQKGVAL